MSVPNSQSASPPVRASDRERLATLFDLGRQVTQVLDLDALLARIPDLIRRLVEFDAFSVYLLDQKSQSLRVAYAIGYPDERPSAIRLAVGQGLVGTAVADREVIVANDLAHDPRYVAIVPGMASEVVVPLLYKSRPIGALNILSSQPGLYDEDDGEIVRLFGVHVAVAIENARLFEREKRDADTFETLAEIGRDMASILDLDLLLERLAQLVKRVIAYRTFGVLLVDDRQQELVMAFGLQYGTRVTLPKVRMGDGLVGYAAKHGVPVNVPDVTVDPRYIKVVDDVRSELAIPMLLKDRCVGVFDLESPEHDAFTKRDVEILELLASQAAVAIENARLYQAVSANEKRLETEVRFARRIQSALLPKTLPKRMRGIDVAAHFEPARELAGDFYDFLLPESNTLVIAVGDVSGKGVAAALYSAMAGELVRSRTFRRRYTRINTTPAQVLGVMNTILRERALEPSFCTLCYAAFDLKRRSVTVSNSGLPYPIRISGAEAGPIEVPGIPLGALDGSEYDEVVLPLSAGDVFVFCTDGVSESTNAADEDFGTQRILHAAMEARAGTARQIVDYVFAQEASFRGDRLAADDVTVAVVKITA
jgi:sigma-B regulation protein RsbU (phosphoserine phosphatase)